MHISFLLDGLQCSSFLSIIGETTGYGSMVTGQLSYCLVWIDTRKPYQVPVERILRARARDRRGSIKPIAGKAETAPIDTLS